MPHHSQSLLALSKKALIALRYGYSYPPPAVIAISAALRANHNHHHATTYRQAARSLGLVLVGVTTDTTRTTVAIGRPCIAWAMEGLMGVPLLPPAEMKNRILGLPNFSGYQASKMVAVSFPQMAAAIPKNLTGSTMPENEEVAPAPTAEAPQEAAQTSDTKAEASSTAKASDELSEDDLDAVAGGYPLGWRGGAPPPRNTGNI